MADKDSYQGPERRREQRRRIVDRRQMIRWEPDKEDRRLDDGRRKDDIQIPYWRL